MPRIYRNPDQPEKKLRKRSSSKPKSDRKKEGANVSNKSQKKEQKRMYGGFSPAPSPLGSSKGRLNSSSNGVGLDDISRTIESLRRSRGEMDRLASELHSHYRSRPSTPQQESIRRNAYQQNAPGQKLYGPRSTISASPSIDFDDYGGYHDRSASPYYSPYRPPSRDAPRTPSLRPTSYSRPASVDLTNHRILNDPPSLSASPSYMHVRSDPRLSPELYTAPGNDFSAFYRPEHPGEVYRDVSPSPPRSPSPIFNSKPRASSPDPPRAESPLGTAMSMVNASPALENVYKELTDELTRELVDVKQDNEKLRSDKKNFADELDEAKRKLDYLEPQCLEFEQTISEAETTIEELNETISRLEKDRQELSEDQISQDGFVKDLRQQLTEKEEERLCQDLRIHELETDFGNAKTEMDNLRMENSELGRETSELKSLNSVLREECQALIDNLAKVQKETNFLRDQLRDSRLALADLRAQCDVVGAERDAMRRELEQFKFRAGLGDGKDQKSLDDMMQLQLRVDAAEGRCCELEAAKTRTEKENEVLREAYESLQKEMSAIKQALKAYQDERRREHEFSEKSIQRLKSELASVRADRDQISQRLVTTQRDLLLSKHGRLPDGAAVDQTMTLEISEVMELDPDEDDEKSPIYEEIFDFPPSEHKQTVVETPHQPKRSAGLMYTPAQTSAVNGRGPPEPESGLSVSNARYNAHAGNQFSQPLANERPDTVRHTTTNEKNGIQNVHPMEKRAAVPTRRAKLPDPSEQSSTNHNEHRTPEMMKNSRGCSEDLPDFRPPESEEMKHLRKQNELLQNEIRRMRDNLRSSRGKESPMMNDDNRFEDIETSSEPPPPLNSEIPLIRNQLSESQTLLKKQEELIALLEQRPGDSGRLNVHVRHPTPTHEVSTSISLTAPPETNTGAVDEAVSAIRSLKDEISAIRQGIDLRDSTISSLQNQSQQQQLDNKYKEEALRAISSKIENLHKELGQDELISERVRDDIKDLRSSWDLWSRDISGHVSREFQSRDDRLRHIEDDIDDIRGSLRSLRDSQGSQKVAPEYVVAAPAPNTGLVALDQLLQASGAAGPRRDVGVFTALAPQTAQNVGTVPQSCQTISMDPKGSQIIDMASAGAVVPGLSSGKQLNDSMEPCDSGLPASLSGTGQSEFLGYDSNEIVDKLRREMAAKGRVSGLPVPMRAKRSSKTPRQTPDDEANSRGRRPTDHKSTMTDDDELEERRGKRAKDRRDKPERNRSGQHRRRGHHRSPGSQESDEDISELTAESAGDLHRQRHPKSTVRQLPATPGSTDDVDLKSTSGKSRREPADKDARRKKSPRPKSSHHAEDPIDASLAAQAARDPRGRPGRKSSRSADDRSLGDVEDPIDASLAAQAARDPRGRPGRKSSRNADDRSLGDVEDPVDASLAVQAARDPRGRPGRKSSRNADDRSLGDVEDPIDASLAAQAARDPRGRPGRKSSRNADDRSLGDVEDPIDASLAAQAARDPRGRPGRKSSRNADDRSLGDVEDPIDASLAAQAATVPGRKSGRRMPQPKRDASPCGDGEVPDDSSIAAMIDRSPKKISPRKISDVSSDTDPDMPSHKGGRDGTPSKSHKPPRDITDHGFDDEVDDLPIDSHHAAKAGKSPVHIGRDSRPFDEDFDYPVDEEASLGTSSLPLYQKSPRHAEYPEGWENGLDYDGRESITSETNVFFAMTRPPVAHVEALALESLRGEEDFEDDYKKGQQYPSFGPLTHRKSGIPVMTDGRKRQLPDPFSDRRDKTSEPPSDRFLSPRRSKSESHSDSSSEDGFEWNPDGSPRRAAKMEKDQAPHKRQVDDEGIDNIGKPTLEGDGHKTSTSSDQDFWRDPKPNEDAYLRSESDAEFEWNPDGSPRRKGKSDSIPELLGSDKELDSFPSLKGKDKDKCGRESSRNSLIEYDSDFEPDTTPRKPQGEISPRSFTSSDRNPDGTPRSRQKKGRGTRDSTNRSKSDEGSDLSEGGSPRHGKKGRRPRDGSGRPGSDEGTDWSEGGSPRHSTKGRRPRDGSGRPGSDEGSDWSEGRSPRHGKKGRRPRDGSGSPGSDEGSDWSEDGSPRHGKKSRRPRDGSGRPGSDEGSDWSDGRSPRHSKKGRRPRDGSGRPGSDEGSDLSEGGSPRHGKKGRRPRDGSGSPGSDEGSDWSDGRSPRHGKKGRRPRDGSARSGSDEGSDWSEGGSPRHGKKGRRPRDGSGRPGSDEGSDWSEGGSPRHGKKGRRPRDGSGRPGSDEGSDWSEGGSPRHDKKGRRPRDGSGRPGSDEGSDWSEGGSPRHGKKGRRPRDGSGRPGSDEGSDWSEDGSPRHGKKGRRPRDGSGRPGSDEGSDWSEGGSPRHGKKSRRPRDGSGRPGSDEGSDWSEGGSPRHGKKGRRPRDSSGRPGSDEGSDWSEGGSPRHGKKGRRPRDSSGRPGSDEGSDWSEDGSPRHGKKARQPRDGSGKPGSDEGSDWSEGGSPRHGKKGRRPRDGSGRPGSDGGSDWSEGGSPRHSKKSRRPRDGQGQSGSDEGSDWSEGGSPRHGKKGRRPRDGSRRPGSDEGSDWSEGGSPRHGKKGRRPWDERGHSGSDEGSDWSEDGSPRHGKKGRRPRDGSGRPGSDEGSDWSEDGSPRHGKKGRRPRDGSGRPGSDEGSDWSEGGSPRHGKKGRRPRDGSGSPGSDEGSDWSEGGSPRHGKKGRRPRDGSGSPGSDEGSDWSEGGSPRHGKKGRRPRDGQGQSGSEETRDADQSSYESYSDDKYDHLPSQFEEKGKMDDDQLRKSEDFGKTPKKGILKKTKMGDPQITNEDHPPRGNEAEIADKPHTGMISLLDEIFPHITRSEREAALVGESPWGHRTSDPETTSTHSDQDEFERTKDDPRVIDSRSKRGVKGKAEENEALKAALPDWLEGDNSSPRYQDYSEPVEGDMINPATHHDSFARPQDDLLSDVELGRQRSPRSGRRARSFAPSDDWLLTPDPLAASGPLDEPNVDRLTEKLRERSDRDEEEARGSSSDWEDNESDHSDWSSTSEDREGMNTVRRVEPPKVPPRKHRKSAKESDSDNDLDPQTRQALAVPDSDSAEEEEDGRMSRFRRRSSFFGPEQPPISDDETRIPGRRKSEDKRVSIFDSGPPLMRGNDSDSSRRSSGVLNLESRLPFSGSEPASPRSRRSDTSGFQNLDNQLFSGGETDLMSPRSRRSFVSSGGESEFLALENQLVSPRDTSDTQDQSRLHSGTYGSNDVSESSASSLADPQEMTIIGSRVAGEQLFQPNVTRRETASPMLRSHAGPGRHQIRVNPNSDLEEQPGQVLILDSMPLMEDPGMRSGDDDSSQISSPRRNTVANFGPEMNFNLESSYETLYDPSRMAPKVQDYDIASSLDDSESTTTRDMSPILRRWEDDDPNTINSSGSSTPALSEHDFLLEETPPPPPLQSLPPRVAASSKLPRIPEQQAVPNVLSSAGLQSGYRFIHSSGDFEEDSTPL